VLLVHIDWDGNIDRDPEDLLTIELGVDDGITERCTVEDAVARLTALVSRGEGSSD
jgi:hypothetical protein